MSDCVNEIKHWLKKYNKQRFSPTKARARKGADVEQALVLFGTSVVDKRQLCSIICKEMGIEVKIIISNSSI